MKRVIISGATGAIGTALINELTQHGVEVLVLVRKDSSRIKNIVPNLQVKIAYCALNQLNEIQNKTGKRYDVFYHLAWEGASGSGRHDMYLQNRNVQYALDAVGVAKSFGCSTFVGAGSQAEYGRVEGLLTTDTPKNPEMGYGYAKLCAGYMTREYAHQLGMKHIWTRILSVYGPNDGTQSMVMSTINKLLDGETPQFTKGEQMWDYLYSDDVARAFRLIGEKGIDGKTYVLGSGKVRPLAEYIKDIRDIVRPEGKFALGAIPYAEKQVMHLQADISDLQKDVGFEPSVDFKDGIRMILQKH